MINLVSLLVAAALVSLQCNYEASAQLDDTKIDVDLLSKQTKVQTNPTKRRNFLKFSPAPPKVVRFEPGTLLELQCIVTAKPAPSVQWLKNGEPIGEYLDESNEIMTPHPSSIASLVSTLLVPAAADGDIFTCVASSGIKELTASSTVFSTEDTDIEELISLRKMMAAPSKPIITEYYDFLMQDIGSNVVLPCRVHSYTKPQIFWQDNYNNLIFGDSRQRVLPSGDLLINKLGFGSDMGGYKCIAKNLFGKTNATTFVYPLKVKH